jgi:hypothetical protein
MQARIRFVNGRPTKRQFIAGFLLPPGTASPRFVNVLENVSRHYFMAWVALSSEADVDAEVRRWVRIAYRFGCQEHLQSGTRL